jgi:acyl phosphate:glycerol-3-phosphate acyltransferase
MQVWQPLAVLVLSYLIGSIPFGLIIVKIVTGKDIRFIESGRTGGTNVMRAAGVASGVITGLMDVFKGFAACWIARWIIPGSEWMLAVAPLVAIVGHDYSVFLIERNEKGHIRFRGGAGGATTLGGAIGIWPYSALIIIPLSLSVFLIVGYASVATISIALFTTLIFLYQALYGSGSWAYVFYGAVALMMCLWALRPNLQRLRNGTERKVGFRAKRKMREA